MLNFFHGLCITCRLIFKHFLGHLLGTSFFTTIICLHISHAFLFFKTETWLILMISAVDASFCLGFEYCNSTSSNGWRLPFLVVNRTTVIVKRHSIEKKIEKASWKLDILTFVQYSSFYIQHEAFAFFYSKFGL